MSEKVVSERGTGGATFAAVVMIIGGAFGFFEGLSLIVRGSFYVQPAKYNRQAPIWGQGVASSNLASPTIGFSTIAPCQSALHPAAP